MLLNRGFTLLHNYYKIYVKIFWKFKRSPIYGIIRVEKNIPYKADDALDQHNYTVDW